MEYKIEYKTTLVVKLLIYTDRIRIRSLRVYVCETNFKFITKDMTYQRLPKTRGWVRKQGKLRLA